MEQRAKHNNVGYEPQLCRSCLGLLFVCLPITVSHCATWLVTNSTSLMSVSWTSGFGSAQASATTVVTKPRSAACRAVERRVVEVGRPARIEQGKNLRGKGGEKRRLLQRMEREGKLVDGEKVVRDAMSALPVARVARAPGERTVLGTKSGKAPMKKVRAGW